MRRLTAPRLIGGPVFESRIPRHWSGEPERKRVRGKTPVLQRLRMAAERGHGLQLDAKAAAELYRRVGGLRK